MCGMALLDDVQAIALRHSRSRKSIQTEEATKTGLVLPLIKALGYDIFNPAEVMPEFTADIVNRKGEKIDFAIMSNKKPIMLIECKRADKPLTEDDIAQLARYFMVVPARIGILTNGIDYLFFSDIDDSKHLDKVPFFTFNIFDADAPAVRELKRFSKSAFNIKEIMPIAEEMKAYRQIKKYIDDILSQKPDDEFIKLLTRQTYTGRISSVQLKKYREICRRALNQSLSERIRNRLNKAIDDEKASEEQQRLEDMQKDIAAEEEKNQIETTVEEIEAFSIIRSILHPKIPAKRITLRDSLSYCAILLDDNNRKPLCRLYFGQYSRSIVLFGKNREETRYKIKEIYEIYNYSDIILKTVDYYK